MALTEADIFNDAREITGNKPSRAVGELGIPDEAIRAHMTPAIRDLNAVYGSSTGLQEVTFTATADQQRYPLADLADDINEIVFVLRGSAYVPDCAYDGESVVDPRTGLPIHGTGIIDWSFAGGARDVMVGQLRQRIQSQFTHEIINDELLLIPCPTWAEEVVVRYTTTANDVTTLPDNARTALVMAASVGIFNCLINRINSDRYTGAQHGVVADDRLKMLIKQRDYYQGEYDREFARLAV